MLPRSCSITDSVVHYNITKGLYEIRFYFLGQWTTVVVDDYLPCRACKSEVNQGKVYPVGAESADSSLW